MRRPAMLTAILAGLAVLTAASSASAMYHPTLGKWASRDPIGYANGMALPEYAGSTPVNLVDPSGLFWLEHPGLTRASLLKAFPKPKPRPPTLGPSKPPADSLGGPKCRAWIEQTLDKANAGQDKGDAQASQQPWRHYCRQCGQSVEGANQGYQDYLKGEEGTFSASLGAVVPPCTTKEQKGKCKEAMEALGRLSHSWQDYFGHAVTGDGSPKAWSEGITGTPDEDNPDLVPASYENWYTLGTHGLREPSWLDARVHYVYDSAGVGQRVIDVNGSELRQQDATNFVAEKFKKYIKEWYDKCKCCCPP